MAYKVIYARGGFIGIYEQQPGLQHKPLYKRIIVHIFILARKTGIEKQLKKFGLS